MLVISYNIADVSADVGPVSIFVHVLLVLYIV